MLRRGRAGVRPRPGRTARASSGASTSPGTARNTTTRTAPASSASTSTWARRRTRWSTSCATRPAPTAATRQLRPRDLGIVDYPFITGRSTPDSYLTGQKMVEVLEHGPAPVRLVDPRSDRIIQDGESAWRRRAVRRSSSSCSPTASHYMFGNPGTVEQGFLDALERLPGLRSTSWRCRRRSRSAIADGYARATERPALVQLHSGVGLGNGIGMLYQAKRGHSPLVVIAGESGIRYDAMDAQMAADLVAMARPVTKWATRVIDPARCCGCCGGRSRSPPTPPSGPGLRRPCRWTCSTRRTTSRSCRPSIPPTRVAAGRRALIDRGGASCWLGAAQPMILMGDGVAVSGAQAELAARRRAAGRRGLGRGLVRGEHRRHATRSTAGSSGHMFGDAQPAAITRKADAVLIVGTYVFPEVFPALDDVFAPGAKIVHVDLDAYEIAKNHPVDLGLVGRPQADAGGARRRSSGDGRDRPRPPTPGRAAGRRPRQRGRAPRRGRRAAGRSRCTRRGSWRSWPTRLPARRDHLRRGADHLAAI